ncbi:hypothetical protein KSS87_019998 [Heliosperma pusillum]|nr:hypothetical protein KSS87_019998 [Heliosperma pusillum]
MKTLHFFTVTQLLNQSNTPLALKLHHLVESELHILPSRVTQLSHYDYIIYQ